MGIDRTDQYYRDLGGFSYPDHVVDKWLTRWFFPYIKFPSNARVLDLCCGDGVWSLGIKRRYPEVTIRGVDISQGAIDAVRSRTYEYGIPSENFIVHDLELPLPWSANSFDIIFARGLFIYNQHDFDRLPVWRIMEHWLSLLSSEKGGLFWGSYASKLHLMGTYAPPEKTRLPINHMPRKTELVDFRGGKFHHSIDSFSRPFLKLNNAEVIYYSYEIKSRHTIVCQRKKI